MASENTGVIPAKKALFALMIFIIAAVTLCFLGGLALLFPGVTMSKEEYAKHQIESADEVRKRGNEASAVASLKAISAAQQMFKEMDASKKYASSLAQLQEKNLIDVVLAGGKKQGYTYELDLRKDVANGFEVIASPVPMHSGRESLRNAGDFQYRLAGPTMEISFRKSESDPWQTLKR